MTGLPDEFCVEDGHVRYPIGLDVGDVAPGHRLIVRGICLFGDQLALHYAWVPGLTVDYSDGGIYPNFRYDHDDGTMTGSYSPCEGGPYTVGAEQYARPPSKARYASFDFFVPSYDEYVHHVDRQGNPDEEYLRNRVSRLTVELATGHAVLES